MSEFWIFSLLQGQEYSWQRLIAQVETSKDENILYLRSKTPVVIRARSTVSNQQILLVFP